MVIRPLLILAAILCWLSPAWAFPRFLERVPRHVGCNTCHNNVSGGNGCSSSPCFNPFGEAFNANGQRWSSDLAALDSDGDGCSNGEELGDPAGSYREGATPPGEADYCARSPGLVGSAGGIAECQRGEGGECCPDTERQRDTCECRDGDRGDPLCATPPPNCEADTFLPNDLSRNSTGLIDAVWTDVLTIGATDSEIVPSCHPGANDVWFSYRPDCVSGRLVIETEDPARLTVYADRRPPSSPDSCTLRPSSDTELACQVGTTRVEIDEARRVLIQASGVLSTRIRVTCEPDGSLFSENTVCGNATTIGDGVTETVIDSGTTDGVSLVAGDSCPSDTEKDKWFRYEASCTGTARVTTRFGRDAPLGSCVVFGEVQAVVGVYSGATTCPERDLTLDCQGTLAEPCRQGDPIETSVPVRRGEELYVRVGRATPLSFTGLAAEIEFQCEPGVDDCANYCDRRAECSVAGDEVTCACRDLYAGDGIPVSRGGSGCVLSLPCEEVGLDCGEHGQCAFDAVGPTCECDPGYEFRFGTCRDVSDCDPRVPGPGVVACNTFRDSRTRCVELDVGFACSCASGYSPVAGADPYTCRVTCGDGKVGPGEECDDGNLNSGDGCTERCEEEDFFNCFEPAGGRSQCEETCGDGLIDEPFEQCDDGNTVSGDGCSETCQNEGAGGGCAASPSARGGLPWWIGLLLVVPLAVRIRRRRRA